MPAPFISGFLALSTPLVTLTVGPDFVEAGQAQNLTLLPPFQYHYTNNAGTATVADAGGFVGVERPVLD